MGRSPQGSEAHHSSSQHPHPPNSPLHTVPTASPLRPPRAHALPPTPPPARSAITDAGMDALAPPSRAASGGGLRKLEELCLRSCPSLTGRGVAALAQGLPRLKRLSLPFCVGVGNDGAAALSRCPSLVWADLSHCWRVSEPALGALRAARPMAEVVF